MKLKRCFYIVICFICIINLQISVFAEESTNKLIVDNINVKNHIISAYFDIADSKGTFNSTDITKENITATLDGEKLNLESLTRFQDSNEGTAYVIMADVSGSMGNKGKDNIKKLFSEMVNKVGMNDKIALITFGDSEKVLQDFTSDKTALISKINTIETKEDNTDLYRAITKGLNELSSNQTIPLKQAIIIMSDGLEDNDQGITKDEVLKKINESHIPIFSIAYKSSNDDKIKEGIKVLGSFSKSSNGQDFVLGDDSKTTTEIINSITSRINKSYVACFEGNMIKMNGQTSNFYLNIKLDEKSSISSNQNIKLPTLVDTVKPLKPSVNVTEIKHNSLTYTPYVVGGVTFVLIILIVFIVWLAKKKKNNKVVKVQLIKLGKKDDEAPYDFILKDSIVIGSDPSGSNVTFKNDELLSGRHCKLVLKDHMVFINDLGSTNGTYVNGVPVSESYRLHNDDILFIGSMELRVGLTDIIN